MSFFRRLSVPTRTLSLLLAGLLGGTVLSASTVGSSVGTVLSGAYSLTQNLSFGYIVYSGTSSGSSASGALSVGNLDSTSGGLVSYSYSLPISLGSGPIAFMGLDSGGGVTLTLNNLMSPTYAGSPWPFGRAENRVVADILAANSAGLVSFLQANSGDFFYAPLTTQATFLTFSAGRPIGAMSLTATEVSEPGSRTLLAAGLLSGLCWAGILLRR